MRKLFRVLIPLVVVLSAVTALWLLGRGGALREQAVASSGLDVPPGCIPPELDGMYGILAHATDPEAREFLLAKIALLEDEALGCAAAATMYPTAAVPTELVGLRRAVPTSSVPTPTLFPGLRHAGLIPVMSFTPTEDGLNAWGGIVDGKRVEVGAGRVHDYVGFPDPSGMSQGALYVMLNLDARNALQPSPSRHGTLHFVAECGTLLVAEGEDGTRFIFDVAAMKYLEDLDACPVKEP